MQCAVSGVMNVRMIVMCCGLILFCFLFHIKQIDSYMIALTHQTEWLGCAVCAVRCGMM